MEIFINESKREPLRSYSFARSIKLKKGLKILGQFFERRSAYISEMNYLIGSGIS